MKRFLFLVGSFFLFISLLHAQNTRLTGKVTESGTNAPVENALVEIPELKISATTDIAGFFEIKNIPPGKYKIAVNVEGYNLYETTVEVKGESMELPPVSMIRIPQDKEGIAEISQLTLDMEDENKDQSVSGLLHASEDIFVSTAGYTFGSMFFRTRGYDSENSMVMINGTEAGDLENGRISWSNWGGLNDAMRNKEVYYGLSSTPFSFSSFGGLTYINTRASQYRKQVKLSYSLTNRTYRNRLMLTYATGLMKKGWAITVSGSRRWSQEGYVPGTFYDAWAYFLAVEKTLGERHTLGLTVFGSPTQRGQQSAAVAEAFDLAGTVYYNPNWGYQDGEKRNAKVKDFHKPVIILNHFWKINEKTNLNSAASYTFGTDNWSALSWYNAADPRPDYYRYLPSYQTSPYVQDLIRSQWQNDPSVSQIDWNNLYQINYLSNYSGQSTRYIIENNVTKSSFFQFNTTINKEVDSHITAMGGLNLKLYKGNHYKVIKDMLGGNYWIDLDQYAERDFPGDSSIAQNDLNNPNRIVYQGDKFGYDYDANINSLDLWGQGEFTYNKIDFYVAGSLSGTQFWRTGHMKNGRHPDNSFGKSKTYNFFDFGIRGGATYKFTGRHFATVNVFYMTRAPFFTNTFISPRIRDDVVQGISNEKIYGGDISYTIRYPWLKARITGFYTHFNDLSEITSFYHDDFLTYVNFILNGIEKYHQGLEIGAEVKIIKFLSVYGVAALGEYRYTSRPETTISFDNGSLPDTSFLTYMKNFYVPGTPQTALSGGFKFNYKFWFVDANVNYYDNNWLDFNPERRTQAAISNLGPGDPLIKEITAQQTLKGGITVDASVGKSFLISKKFYLNVNLSVSNLLNNKDIQSGGYEQNRFDFETKNVSKFPPKYYYSFGTTYYFNISFRL